VKNRYMLTKASFLDKLQEETKAEIITRGKYYPNKSMATPKDPVNIYTIIFNYKWICIKWSKKI